MPNSEATISKYDRIRGALNDVPEVIFTKPSTVRVVQPLTAKTETFVVETGRADDMGGDFIFVECVDETGVTRLALPPKVAAAIASQRDSLTARRRSRAAQKRAAGMTEEQKQVLRARLAKARKQRGR